MTPCHHLPRPVAALLAGAVAIMVNILLLDAADLVPVETAHGGLLRLLSRVTGITLHGDGARTVFHAAVGIAMTLFYALVVEPKLSGPAWRRGLVCALPVWVVNAAIVLPLAGQGFAGSRTLSGLGMIWFAVAHTVFFVLQAVFYARLMRAGCLGRHGSWRNGASASPSV